MDSVFRPAGMERCYTSWTRWWWKSRCCYRLQWTMWVIICLKTMNFCWVTLFFECWNFHCSQRCIQLFPRNIIERWKITKGITLDRWCIKIECIQLHSLAIPVSVKSISIDTTSKTLNPISISYLLISFKLDGIFCVR